MTQKQILNSAIIRFLLLLVCISPAHEIAAEDQEVLELSPFHQGAGNEQRDISGLELSPNPEILQREITPEIWLKGYSYQGSYIDPNGTNFDVFFDRSIACENAIIAAGKIVDHHAGGDDCSLKACYSSKQVFVESFQCRS